MLSLLLLLFVIVGVVYTGEHIRTELVPRAGWKYSCTAFTLGRLGVDAGLTRLYPGAETGLGEAGFPLYLRHLSSETQSGPEE